MDQLSFREKLSNQKLPLLVDFYATWCAPCKMLSPVMESISEKFEGKLEVIKVNIDDQPDVSESCSIMSVPTLIFFKNGKEIRRETGFYPEDELSEIINEEFGI